MKNAIYLAVAILLAAAPLFSQNEKGVSPLNPQSVISNPQSTTRAVVIGISDYQEKVIPDLRFADRDAEAFANFLRSPAGGSLDNDHLQVLTNQNATAGQVAAALDWLLEQSKEGDEAIIYFSGHGDVEGKKLSQPGFLLCWDAPSRVYMGGGTYSLSFLQEIVSTLSVQNKAKVVVITDACHAGKLAGSQIGGAQLTSANLAKQYANEVKILSCQPNEFSLEGEQWGGGRGVFSYHLVDGLAGLADRNGDGSVSLGEIDRYLEDHVTAEAAPQSQVPMLLGNKTERLATVNSGILADLKKAKSRGLPMFSATDGRGLEEDVLAKLDSGIVKKYFAFKKAVAEKRFFQPENDCAEAFYTALSAEPGLAPLYGFMKRNYAAALQDDAQQVLNEWLKTDQTSNLAVKTEGSNRRLPQKAFTAKITAFPRCLDRAAELLGNNHYLYATLKARKFFFEGYLLAHSNLNPNQELGNLALASFRQSLKWQPEQPQVYWQMSMVYGYNLLLPDSLEHYARQAIRAYPDWITPYGDAASVLSYEFKKFDRAKIFLEQASQIDADSAEVLTSWAAYFFSQNRFAEAEPLLKKAIARDPADVSAMNNLGYIYCQARRFDEAELFLKKAVAIDSTFYFAWSQLGGIYAKTRRTAEAELVLKKAIALDSSYANPWNTLGFLYSRSRQYAEAEPLLKKAIELDSTNSSFWNNLGFLYYQTRRYEAAELALKKAIAADGSNPDPLNVLGNLYMQTRHFAEAEPILKKAISLDTLNASNWNNLGFFYNQTRRFAEAEPALIRAFELDPSNASHCSNLGYSYAMTGRYAEAEAILKKAIALDSTFASPRKHLGLVYFKTGRPAQAQLNFLKALELNPNYAAAMLGMAYPLFSEKKTTEALGWVEKAIGKGSTFEQLETDENLAPLKALPEWGTLMKKHFPDRVKD